MNTRFNLTTPEAIITAVPHLVGFHPQPPNLVVIGCKDSKVTIAGSIELDHADEQAIAIPGGIIDASDAILLIGYGPREATEPVVWATAAGLLGLGTVTIDLGVIVHEGRYWNLATDTPDEGIALEAGPSALDAAVVAGGLQTFPSRDAIDALFTLDDADPAIPAAFTRARDDVKAVEQDPDALDTFAAEAIRLLHEAIHEAVVKAVLPDIDVTARLIAALTIPLVRDIAMAIIDDDPARAYEDLWVHLVRHAPPDLRTAPAVLAAYSAWRGGAGHIAVAALAAIGDEDHDDPTAAQLQQLINDAVHPEMVPAYEPGEPLARRAGGDTQKGR